jgi:hypothetical protein
VRGGDFGLAIRVLQGAAIRLGALHMAEFAYGPTSRINQ